jgi:streptogramin lyase
MRRLGFVLLALLLAAPGSAVASANVRGRAAEYRLAPGTHAQALVAGPDGNVWFAGLNYGIAGITDVIGRVTPGGKVTEFRLGTHAANLGLSDIAVGPEGNLWFTEGGRPELGRITTAGEVTEFTVPSGASPSRIAAGSDGNLWFTEERSNAVGRISPTGAVTEFPLLEGESGAFGIAAGSDGALWITEPSIGKVGRIGTDGAMTNFLLPEPGGYPLEIVAGPDGGLWFGKERGGVLGRITTAGTVSEFSVPAGRQTYALTSGPAGDLWYSNGGGRIGSITPAGETARPACIRSCRLPITALAQGPEGRLWFAAGTEPQDPVNTTKGTVGTFAPPPLRAEIVSGPEQRGRFVRTEVRCDWGAAGSLCKGALSLTASGSTRKGGFRFATKVGLHLRHGTARRFRIRLPRELVRALAEGRRFTATVNTAIFDGHWDRERAVLRPA